MINITPTIKRTDFVSKVPTQEIYVTLGAKACIGCNKDYSYNQNLGRPKVVNVCSTNHTTYALCHEKCEDTLVNKSKGYSYFESRFFEPESTQYFKVCDEKDKFLEFKIFYKNIDEITCLHRKALGLD